MVLTTNPHLVPGAWKGRAMPLLLCAFFTCYRMKVPFYVSKKLLHNKIQRNFTNGYKSDVHVNELFLYHHTSSTALFINKSNYIITIIEHCIPQACYNYLLSSEFQCPSHMQLS